MELSSDYTIPIGTCVSGYRLLKPLLVEQFNSDGVSLWTKHECLDEWGLGNNLEEAIADLISSLGEYKTLLERMTRPDEDSKCALAELSQLIAPSNSNIISPVHDSSGNS